jgi:hypothetical protein
LVYKPFLFLGLTLSGGQNPSGAAGILNDGTLLITNSTLANNLQLEVRGGRGAGGLRNTGTAILANSLVTGNHAQFGASGIENEGMLVLTESTLADNTHSGPMHPGTDAGGLLNTGDATLTDCSIFENHGVTGGGILNQGTLTLVNCTVAGNQADFTGGGILNDGELILMNGTVAFNRAGPFTFAEGGGLHSRNTTVMVNTLLAKNIAEMGIGNDCRGSVISLGHNLIETTAGCDIIPQATDLVGQDPLLGLFTDEEVPGRGHFPLMPGSPAISAADAAVCPFTDQLGQPRGGVCDIGAVEFQATILIVSETSIPPGGTLTATWTGITTPTPTDWIGLFAPGTPNTAYIDWIYVSCSQSAGSPQAFGSCPFIVPASLAPGRYELRLLANDGFTDLLATSTTLTVAAAEVTKP